MRTSKTPSARPARGVPLTPAQMGRREKNLAHLMIIAHKEGVPAAMEEFDRMTAEREAKKARSLQVG
jgi:hypothetical protein